ncbi:UNVERIFIED_CONTAM: hypothetical protein RMT77_008667 [Armadillidium vulgare]
MDKKNESEVEKREVSKDDQTKTEKDLYLNLFSKTIDGKGPAIDHSLLQQKCEFETEVSLNAELIHGEEMTESVLMPSVTSNKTELIERHLAETQAKHKLFYKKLLDKEHLLQLQEERRKECEILRENLASKSEEKEIELKNLLQKGFDVQNDTKKIKTFVEASKIYKDYVERNIPLWEKEAKGVHDICGRFRDLLTLRFQLFIKVIETFQSLKNTRIKHQEMIKKEESEEGRSLLEVYRYKESLQKTNQSIEHAEAELKALRNDSLKVVTDLTRVRLALTNMYNVACRFQSALPPLHNGMEPIEILEHLHNFIIDATQMLKITQMENDAASLKVNKDSR